MAPNWHELAERIKNFHGDYDGFLEYQPQNEYLFTELNGIIQSMVTEIETFHGLSEARILRMAFTRVYDLLTVNNDVFKCFARDSRLYDSVFEASFFNTLCMFLHHTKKADATSVTKFTEKYRSTKYDAKSSQEYYNSEKFESTKLRKMRKRLLSQRPVFIKRQEWSAMSADSEFEWSIYFILEKLDDRLQDTFKRIGNLYNDINKVFQYPRDDTFENQLKAAYKKFFSKLSKIKYEDLLDLQKVILEFLSNDKEYYGMNLYRFEKNLRLYNLTMEVKSLLRCKDGVEVVNLLEKYIILKDICFPQVYRDFSAIDDITHIAALSSTFLSLQKTITISCCLVLDDLITNGYLGNWKKVILDILNDITEMVLYNPEQIDFTAYPGSQEAFIKIISGLQRVILSREIGLAADSIQEILSGKAGLDFSG